MLKKPHRGWETAWYFFFGGLAAGCDIIASLAALFGSRQDRTTTRAGYYLALLALLPCPPLLIKDLGQPERFLNMLRMFKVKSPMSIKEGPPFQYGSFSLLILSVTYAVGATN